MTSVSLPSLDDFNGWADFWFAKGLNVIPADTKNKRTFVKWSEWQIKPIPEGLFQEWKDNNAFANGMAIIVGRVWRGEHTGKYFTFIDCDNATAIKEFCTRNGETVSLDKLAEKFIVEMHEDDLTKCHIYFFTTTPFPKKSSDINNNNNNNNPSFDPKEIPAFEVKSEGVHGIAYCAPSVHKNGYPYEIIGTTEPETLNETQTKEMLQHLDNICKKYGLKYLENDNGNGRSLIPTTDLFKDNFVIYEKQNRHEALLRVMESLIKRTYDIYSLEEIKEQSSKWNQKHCIPPLDDREFEKQWKDATKYIIPKIEEEKTEEEEETTTEETQGQQQQEQPPEQQEEEQQPQIELTEDLTKEVTFDYIANDILSISIKKDYSAKVISFNAMLLAQTNKDQQNTGYQAESAAGKSYIATELATYFPLNELRIIATASPTAFFHDNGVWDDKRKAIIIDLRHKIIIFLDQPNYQLMERLRPILSKDSPELHYMITDKNQRGGNRTKNIIILGYASFFFCTAKVDPDEQEKTRMNLLSPSSDAIKLEESLKLIALRQGNPEEYDRRIGHDHKRKWLMDRILAIRQMGIREVITPGDGYSVGERFLREHPNLLARHQRDLPRIFGFVKAHALLNCFNRDRPKEGQPDTILATQADVNAGFALYKEIEESNELGLSPYIYKIYKEVIEPNLDRNPVNPNGLSRKDLRSKYYSVFHKSLAPRTEESIIMQIESAGLIQQEPDPEDRRKVLIYPPSK